MIFLAVLQRFKWNYHLSLSLWSTTIAEIERKNCIEAIIRLQAFTDTTIVFVKLPSGSLEENFRVVSLLETIKSGKYFQQEFF